MQVPPDIDVLVRNSRVLYLDAARSVAWDFQDVAGGLRRVDDVLTIEAVARPPADFADRIEVTAQAFVAADGDAARFTGDWRLSADLDGVDLAVAARLFPPSAVAPQTGRGDVAVWLNWQEGALAGGTVDLELADVTLQSPLGAVDSSFERIALSGNWQQTSDTWNFALRDVAVTRSNGAWPEAATVDIDVKRDAAGVSHFALRSSFLRLEDLTPFFAPLPESRLLGSWFTLAPRGDLRAVDLALTRDDDDRIEYSVAAEFAKFGIERFEDLPGMTGLTGQLRADARAGRLELASADATLDWPALFRGAIEAPELRGIVVWRAGQDAMRVVSDDLLVATPAASLRSNLELTLPMDGSSPVLDLRTEVSEFDLAAVPQYLPTGKMPATVVAWLDSALRGGRATGAELTFTGPVRSFPFDGGEGSFHASVLLEDGQLAFVRDWPMAEDLDGTVEFTNAQFAARGSGRVLGNRAADMRVRYRRLALRRFHARCGHDRRARSGARLLERRAVDRALFGRRLRAARCADRHRGGEPRSCAAAAQSQRVSVEGRARHHRRRARVPRFRSARHGDPGLAHARRRRAARHGLAGDLPRRPRHGERCRGRRARLSRAHRPRRRGRDRRDRRRVQLAVRRAACGSDELAR